MLKRFFMAVGLMVVLLSIPSPGHALLAFVGGTNYPFTMVDDQDKPLYVGTLNVVLEEGPWTSPQACIVLEAQKGTHAGTQLLDCFRLKSRSLGGFASQHPTVVHAIKKPMTGPKKKSWLVYEFRLDLLDPIRCRVLASQLSCLN